MQKVEADLTESIKNQAKDYQQQGKTVSYLVVDKQVVGFVVIGDRIKDTAAEAVKALQDDGVDVIMLTGDNEDTALTVAKTLGLSDFKAGMLPQDKMQFVEQLQDKGHCVAMAGDGINDAPALATADIGIAIGAGADVAVEAGHIVLVRSDPRDIPKIVALSRATYRKMVQNLWWAAGYNIVSVPLAAGVLAGVGIILSPAVGAVLMSLSTVIVALNAQLLKRQIKN
jgi:Cu2+-exporting ATPase